LTELNSHSSNEAAKTTKIYSLIAFIVGLALIAIAINATVLVYALNERNIISNDRNALIERELEVKTQEQLLVSKESLETVIRDLKNEKLLVDQNKLDATKILEGLTQSIEKRRTAIAERDAALIVLKNAKDDQKKSEEEFAKLDKDIAEKQQVLAGIDANIATKNNEIGLLNTTLTKTQAELKIAETNLAARETEVAQQTAELDKQKTIYQTAIGTFGALTENIRISNVAFESLETRYQDLLKKFEAEKIQDEQKKIPPTNDQ
jgi:chromosome segregation ATPase